MFNFWKRRNNQKKAIEKMYKAVVEQARRPIFYQSLGVPDTADGRFDLILLHAFLVHYRIKDEQGAIQCGQALFDHSFREFDKALREMGVGDLKVPRQMKHMMKSYKGRLVSYADAMDNNKSATDIKEALARNLYRKNSEIDVNVLVVMERYLKDNVEYLGEQSWQDISAGQIEFKEPKL